MLVCTYAPSHIRAAEDRGHDRVSSWEGEARSQIGSMKEPVDGRDGVVGGLHVATLLRCDRMCDNVARRDRMRDDVTRRKRCHCQSNTTRRCRRKSKRRDVSASAELWRRAIVWP